MGFIVGIALYAITAPQITHAETKKPTLVHNGSLTICKLDKSAYHVVKTVKRIITAYNADPNQTDDRPREAASGKEVFDGMIASNDFKFGTKIRIPELFGDKIFTVEDRMHKRKKGMMDVFMEDYAAAVQFGAKHNITVEILEI